MSHTEKKKVKKWFFIAALALLAAAFIHEPPLLALAQATTAAEQAVGGKMDILKSIVSSVVSGLGMIICLWGILELGMALQSNDGGMMPHSMKRIAGGFVMCVAPTILTAFLG